MQQPESQNGPPTKKRRLNDVSNGQRFDLSFLMGLRPKNDLEDSVFKWAYDALGGKGKSVEIEASLGYLETTISKEVKSTSIQEQKRISESYNLGSIVVVDLSKFEGRYVPGVKPDSFRRLNTLLNTWTAKTVEAGGQMPRVVYQRKMEIDKFYDNGVRVTLDVKENNKVKMCFQKEKVSDLNLVCPHSCYDIRFSAKMEKETFIPKNQIVKKVRAKDRISYLVDDIFSIDLSTIHSYDQSARDPKFVERLGQILKSQIEKTGSEKLPKTADCEVTFEVEIEIFKKEDLFTRRQAFQKSLQENKQSADGFKPIIYHLLQHIQHLNGLATDLHFTPPSCVVK